MYAVFCGVHIVVLIGVFVLFLLCVRNTTSPAKLSFMLTCFSLFILISLCNNNLSIFPVIIT